MVPLPAINTLRIADGAFPVATTFTPHPVGLVNLDQSPGSPTPISARLSLPPAASALFRSNGKGTGHSGIPGKVIKCFMPGTMT